MHHRLSEKVSHYLSDIKTDELAEFLLALSHDYQSSETELQSLRYALDDKTNKTEATDQVAERRISQLESIEKELKQTVSLISATLETSQEGVLVIGNDNQPITVPVVIFMKLFESS